ncbi:MAG TPA: GntR family transcriptional regulator [Candidatus Rothia avicola]|uniref:GntR family transcriptional regulator n=1 Tax=Candidatus Rothia avicola TaxID=2840478 RepID=A0A9D1ZRZ6_9MICC|nr:GntR family transcriptional regulator [Candidatus Rothia avicola]
MLTGDKPIFQQIADHISGEILAGTYAEESQVPSTNEFALFYRINPATAGKGVNLLVDQGVLYKKRGIGMFVATGAQDILRTHRRRDFIAGYITPLIDEARTLGLSQDEVLSALRAGFNTDGVGGVKAQLDSEGSGEQA